MDQIESVFSSFWGSQPNKTEVHPSANKAFTAFKLMGLPNKFKNEEWKYTSLKDIEEYCLMPYTDLADRRPHSSEKPRTKEATQVIEVEFRNGRLIGVPDSVDGLTLKSFWDLPDAKQRLDKLQFKDGIEALHQSFSSQGLYIHVAKNSVVKPLLKINFIADREVSHKMICPLVLIEMEDNSELAVLECHTYSWEKEGFFSNIRIISEQASGSRLGYYKWQTLTQKVSHIDHSSFNLERDAHLETFNLSLGGRLSRYDLNIALAGEGSEVVLDGVYKPHLGQHIDHHTVVDHKVPHCRSSQLYKGIIKSNSRAVFNGKVFIREGALGSNAEQLNKNLLMGDGAEVDTKPQMEIDADDVKCGHGATTGSIDLEQIFYLQSRGIPLVQAERMLAQGFMKEVVEKISHRDIKLLFLSALDTVQAEEG